MTRVLRVDSTSPEPHAIEEAARVLRGGGLVAFPTETVYGLGALALDERAVASIFEAKGRPRSHPLIAHVEGEAGALRVAARWDEQARRFAAAFWPGPLTLVVKRRADVPAVTSGFCDTIAVRAPAHPVALAILRAVGEPIAAPSANRFQTLSPTRAEHVLRTLDGRIDLLIDGGPCATGIESTVLALYTHPPRVLRPGAVELASLRRIDSSITAENEQARADEERASPGMDPRHYAPRARLRLSASRDDAERLARALFAEGRSVALLLRGDAPARPEDDGRIARRNLPSDAAGYGRELFAALHALDEAGVTDIVVEDVPTDPSFWAVADRLRRGSVG